MSAETVCRVCLVNNINLYSVRNDLQNVYERIMREKYNRAGYPVHMCYICLTVLRKCHRFMETAQDANNVLKKWYKLQNEMRVPRPLYTYSVIKVDSSYGGDASVDNEIKVEKTDSEPVEVQPDVKFNIRKADNDKQTNFTQLWIDIHKDNTSAENTEVSVEEKPDLKEINSCGLNVDVKPIKTKTKIVEHDDGTLPIKKRNTNRMKIQCMEKEEKQFSCDICSYKTKQKHHLIIHIRTHTAEKPFKCQICNNVFKQKTHLTRHEKIHNGEKPFSCNFCDYKCKLKTTLVTHIRTHTFEKPFLCYICSHKFGQKGDLNSHMRTHTGEKPFSCDVCDYKCARSNALKVHRRVHNGEKPYSCELCPYKCAVKGSLKTHIRVHTGDKPFSCQICDYKCKQKGALKTHMQVHTGYKPFCCEICEYKFKRKDVLIQHMRGTYW